MPHGEGIVQATMQALMLITYTSQPVQILNTLNHKVCTQQTHQHTNGKSSTPFFRVFGSAFVNAVQNFRVNDADHNHSQEPI